MYLAIDADSDEITTKRRKVRKGTHSCQECRRRKVKYVFAQANDPVCVVCKRRGTKCISQCDSPWADSVGDKATSLSLTVNADENDRLVSDDLEAKNAGSAYLTEHPAASNSLSTAKTATEPTCDTHLDLKKNDSHSRQIADGLAHTKAQAHQAIRDSLLCALPSQADISILSETVNLTSAICYQSDYRYHSSEMDKAPQDQIPAKSLLASESHPTLLARQMLLFAASIQHLSPQKVVPGLAEHQHNIMTRLADAAIKLVNIDDALLRSLDGVENLIFEIFYHIDYGNIRRAWMPARRAVTVSQMLGLHRPGHYRFTLINKPSDLDPEIIWSTIVAMERMLSLLLGLPTSTAHMILADQKIAGHSALGRNLTVLVGTLTAKILERNRVESAQESLSMTGEIDQEIILAAEQMPAAFWRPLSFVGLEKDSLEALTETRRAFGHIHYHSLVVQLHLPYLLSPYDASQRVYSKIACVNAGREILTRYVELRASNTVSACCCMSDFLALIAGLALILGHITSHNSEGRDQLLAHQRLGDRATVKRALDSIDGASDAHGDVLSVRCVVLLKDLLDIEENAARQHNLRLSQPGALTSDCKAQSSILVMRVPYLGNIQISQEGVAALSVSRAEHAKGLSEGVTLGGIGSMLVRQPHSLDDDGKAGSLDLTRPSIPPQSVDLDPKPNHNVGIGASACSADWHAHSNSLFPDAAATFDDWVFQGVDTAFMETLMSGSAVPLSEETIVDGWDVSDTRI